MKEKFKRFYMKTAINTSELSYCERAKVGAIIVKDDSIIAYGYNGTPSGDENVCEINNKTKPEVIHAELNAIAKVARSNNSCYGAAMFITHSPCMECTKLILQSGIVGVYYQNDYKDPSGLNLLKHHNVYCEKVNL